MKEKNTKGRPVMMLLNRVTMKGNSKLYKRVRQQVE